MSYIQLPSGREIKQKINIINFETIQAFTLLSSVMFLPSAVCYLIVGTSHSPGLVVAGGMIMLLLSLRHFPSNVFFPVLTISLLVFIHLILAVTVTSSQFDKAFLSIFLFSFIFVSSFTLGKWIFTIPGSTLNFVTSILRIIMIIVALASILDIEPRGFLDWEKAIFPFTEPSHYALIFTPLLLDACVKSRGWKRYAWLLLGYVLSYFLESLSLVAGTTLAALITLPLVQLSLGGLAVPLLLLSLDLSYFTDRLDFGHQTTNLSALVYIQGQELIFDSLERTSGWGIGFQQLGYGPIRSTASKVIFQITGLDLNLYDGGFVSAKLISEFGIFGAALTIAFIVVAAKSALVLRRIAYTNMPTLPGRDLALAFIVGYSIDMFVRGVGYFSASSVLFLAALIFTLGNRNARPVARIGIHPTS